jgi:hypothetical protein
MNVFWAVCLVAASVGVAVAAILLVRRRAPDGGYFNDSDRASGVFGVLATGFAITLGFVVFLAFTSYDNSKAGAEEEARVVTQQFETAQFMGPGVAPRLGDQLICYARSVVHEEWPRLEAGGEPTMANRWAVPMFRTVRAASPATPAQEAAYSKWLDQTTERQVARQDRIHGADGVIPTPLWIVLLFTAAVIFGYMLLYADSGERTIAQATLIGSVAAVLSATILLISFLDDPYRPGVGQLEPVAMERALRTLDLERQIVGSTGPLPCSETGAPAR